LGAVLNHHNSLMLLNECPKVLSESAIVTFVETPRQHRVASRHAGNRVSATSVGPYAKTTTLADIGREVGSPRAVRAVGTACSHPLGSPSHATRSSEATAPIRTARGGATTGNRGLRCAKRKQERSREMRYHAQDRYHHQTRNHPC